MFEIRMLVPARHGERVETYRHISEDACEDWARQHDATIISWVWRPELGPDPGDWI